MSWPFRRPVDARTAIANDPCGMSGAIEVRGLGKTYPGGIRAVDGIDMRVERGEVFGLLGPNGAGKTTTVGMCTTQIRPTEGTVTIHETDAVAHPAAAKQQIGVATQVNTLDRSLTLWENLFYHCLYFGMGTKPSRRRADELLEQFALTSNAKTMPEDVSGGMAQRVQLARAVAHRPRVLFLDEPTAGLDPQSRLALWEMVRTLHSEGLTVLLTTHYMEEADELCDRVAIIDHGRILVCDTPAALKRSIGAESVLTLSLSRTDAALPSVLGELDGVVGVERTDDGARLLAARADGLVADVVRAVESYGVRDVSVAEPSLETVFLSLTGRELRD